MPTINSRFYIKAVDSPIFLKSYESLKTILARIYGKEIPVVGSLDENDINRELGRVTQNVAQYPYFIVVPSNLTDNLESYNSYDLKKYGTNPIKFGDYWYTFHLKPVKLTCSIIFQSQSFLDIVKYMSNWNYNAREGTFRLKTKEGVSFDIQVHIEPDASFPSKDFAEGNPLRVLSTIVLDTYVGEIYKSASLEKMLTQYRIITSSDFILDEEHSILLNPNSSCCAKEKRCD